MVKAGHKLSHSTDSTPVLALAFGSFALFSFAKGTTFATFALPLVPLGSRWENLVGPRGQSLSTLLGNTRRPRVFFTCVILRSENIFKRSLKFSLLNQLFIICLKKRLNLERSWVHRFVTSAEFPSPTSPSASAKSKSYPKLSDSNKLPVTFSVRDDLSTKSIQELLTPVFHSEDLPSCQFLRRQFIPVDSFWLWHNTGYADGPKKIKVQCSAAPFRSKRSTTQLRH